MVTEWFETFKKDDYARSGNQVEQDFVLPEGKTILPPLDPGPSPLARPTSRSTLPPSCETLTDATDRPLSPQAPSCSAR